MPSEPILQQFNLVVDDMEESAAFYRLLGVVLSPADAQWSAHHRSSASPSGAQFNLDSVAGAQSWDVGWGDGRRMGVLGFSVNSRQAVDEIYDRMIQHGYGGEQAPFDAFWGSRFAVVRDPDGNAVGIMSPRDDALTSSPPDI